MKSFSFEVPDEYPNVLLACMILSVECILTNYMMIVPGRIKNFPQAWMDKFKEEHQNSMGEDSVPM